MDLLPRNHSTFCRIGNVPVLMSLKTKMKAGVVRMPDSSWRDVRAPSCSRRAHARAASNEIYQIQRLASYSRHVISEKGSISVRNSFSDLPSGEQMNQCVPLAHYLACFAKQRSSGLRQRIERCLGFRPFLMLSSSEGTRTYTGRTASMVTQRRGESTVIQAAADTGRTLLPLPTAASPAPR